MRAGKGTTIIEFLVYLTLFSFVIICCISWIVGCLTLFNSHHTKRTALINQCTVFDMLIRDLQSAPAQPATWHCFSPHEIVWNSSSDDDIGWLFKDKTIYRYQGTYKSDQKSWSQKNTAIVAKPVDNLVFSSPDSQRMVTITLTNNNKNSSLTISLKKGPLPWKQKKEGQLSS